MSLKLGGFVLVSLGIIVLTARLDSALTAPVTVGLAVVGLLLFPPRLQQRGESERANPTPQTTREASKRDPRVTGFILVAVGILAAGASFAFSCDGRYATSSRAPTCSSVTNWPVLAVFQSGALVRNDGIPTSVAMLSSGAIAFVGIGLLVFGKRPGS